MEEKTLMCFILLYVICETLSTHVTCPVKPKTSPIIRFLWKNVCWRLASWEISVIFSYLTSLLNLAHGFPKWGREEEREYNRLTRFKNIILSTGLTEKEMMIGKNHRPIVCSSCLSLWASLLPHSTSIWSWIYYPDLKGPEAQGSGYLPLYASGKNAVTGTSTCSSHWGGTIQNSVIGFVLEVSRAKLKLLL